MLYGFPYGMVSASVRSTQAKAVPVREIKLKISQRELQEYIQQTLFVSIPLLIGAFCEFAQFINCAAHFVN